MYLFVIMQVIVRAQTELSGDVNAQPALEENSG